MSIFTDEKEQRPENRIRREKMMKLFKAAMLNPAENLQVSELAGLIKIENNGYFLGFLITNPYVEVDYARTLVEGDYENQSARDRLFYTELLCQEGKEGLNLESPIPVLVLNKETVVECIVIDYMTLSSEERDQMVEGCKEASSVLKNMIV